jgi:sn-glycerol 3-phosphate transport system permease protein
VALAPRVLRAEEAALAARPAGRAAARRRRAVLVGHLYLAPAAALTLLFVYWPLLASTALSGYDWNLVSPTWTWVGGQNYRDLVESRAFWLSLVNTATAAAALTALTVLAPLPLAVAVLRVAPRWQGVYRVVLFSPTVISMAVACAIWLWMFHPLHGVLDTLLRVAGLPGPAWLTSSDWALWSIVLVTAWKTFGFNFFVYLAGLLAIPVELHEAARVDGATERRIFWHITAPLLGPTILFVLLTTFILGPQNLFIPTQILTQGGPNDASNNLGYLVYQLGFEYFRVGYASAAATVIFLVFLALTAVQFFLGERRVHYGG